MYFYKTRTKPLPLSSIFSADLLFFFKLFLEDSFAAEASRKKNVQIQRLNLPEFVSAIQYFTLAKKNIDINRAFSYLGV